MKPIRVALSGSGFKFPAHVGALMAIADTGFTPIEYAGTSGGSIIATLAACGMPLDVMRKMTLTRDWSDMLSFSPWSAITDMGYCSGSALLDWITKKTSGKTFADLDVELTVVASDVSTEKPFIFSKENTPATKVALAARASASIPFVYSAVNFQNALLMDGGCVNNIPVDKLTVDDVPRMGVQLISNCTPLAGGVHSIFDIAPRVIDMMLSANENAHVDFGTKLGAKFVFVETGYASGLDRNMSASIREELMNDGYKSTKEALRLL